MDRLVRFGQDLVQQLRRRLQPEEIILTEEQSLPPQIRVRAIRPSTTAAGRFRIDRDQNGVPGFRVTEWRLGDRSKGAVTEITPARSRRRIKIAPPLRGWAEHNWQQVREGEYRGEYRIGNRTWRGRVETPARRNRRGNFDFYIYRPPNGVSRHACWHHAGEGWYWVNYTTPPPDLLSGIKHIEDFIAHVA